MHTCFVCTAADGGVISTGCACTSRYAHPRCIAQAAFSNSTRSKNEADLLWTTCTVCSLRHTGDFAVLVAGYAVRDNGGGVLDCCDAELRLLRAVVDSCSPHDRFDALLSGLGLKSVAGLTAKIERTLGLITPVRSIRSIRSTRLKHALIDYQIHTGSYTGAAADGHALLKVCRQHTEDAEHENDLYHGWQLLYLEVMASTARAEACIGTHATAVDLYRMVVKGTETLLGIAGGRDLGKPHVANEKVHALQQLARELFAVGEFDEAVHLARSTGGSSRRQNADKLLEGVADNKDLLLLQMQRFFDALRNIDGAPKWFENGVGEAAKRARLNAGFIAEHCGPVYALRPVVDAAV